MKHVRQAFYIIGLLLSCIAVASLVRDNTSALALSRAWMNAQYAGPVDQRLHDGLPDAWDLTWWDGATQIIQVEKPGAFQGEAYVHILRTNMAGAVVLSQDISVQPQATVVGSVASRGAGGAIVIWFRRPGEDWIKQGFGGWAGIQSSAGWHRTSLTVTVPVDMTEIKFMLQANGSMAYDDAQVHYQNDGRASPNLLDNPGFEQDGIDSLPLSWWQEQHVAEYQADAGLNLETDLSLSYLNVIDMLSGHVDAVRHRAARLADRCALAPAMTSWLLALGDRFQEEGGAAAREQLNQLAIALAPNCPQPYAELAELYESRHAYQRASELYHQAAQLSAGTILAGRYSFAEGYLAIRYTGDVARAVSALSRAVSLTGWEGNSWYKGAAIYFWGQALESADRIPEALEAYQRVLDCAVCDAFQASARQRLQYLKAKLESP